MILKRTNDYVLFKLNGGSAIINGKFIRNKESEEYIFISLPPTYQVAVRTRDFIDGKWVTTQQHQVSANDIVSLVKEYSQKLIKEDLPF